MDKYNIIIDNTKFDMNLIWQILDIKKEMPHVFYERMQKLSFYFMFPYSIWSKSRTDRNFIPFENIEADINRYEDNGCGLYFEFENVDIKSDCFQDRYSNLVLKTAKGKDAYAVVFNTDLAKYIKENYPEIKLVQSEIQRNVYIEAPYDFNVIDYISYKNNKDKFQNKSSYILTVNSFCKNLYRCANLLSNIKLNYNIDRPIRCADRVQAFSEMQKNELFVSMEEINKINDSGIENFFVKANSDDRFEILETYIYYLIKPEFRDSIRLRLIKSCFTNR